MRRLFHALVVGVAIGISMLVAAAGTERAPAALPAGAPLSGAAVFASDLGIYVANLDGTGLKRLTRDGYDAGPVWSPDGKRIAFSRTVGWNIAVMVMNADGAGSRRVGWGEGPVWSPDGTRLAFVDGPGVEDVSSGKTIVPAPAGFTIAKLDGSGTRRVGVGEVYSLSWSPDGKRIAYTVRRDDWIHLYGVRARKATRLARIAGAYGLAWSPEGRQIAASAGKGIELVDVSTGRVSRLTGEGSGPRWSPDGTRIAFNRGDPESDVAQLLTIGRDGRGQRRVVTKMTGYSWAGDGGLLFTKPRSVGEGADIWWVQADGGGAKPITHAFPTGAGFGEPQWAATVIAVPPAAPVAAISLEPSHVLATRAAVLALAADDRRVAFETTCSGGPLAVWDATGHFERVVGTSCDSENGRRELALAGNRTAWISDNYSMIASWLEVATPGAKPIDVDYADEKADGGAIGNLTGEGELLVYNTWGTGGGYEPKTFVPTLWRIVGTTRKQVVSGADAFAVVDVDAGRIAVLRDDGRLVILDRLGNRLSAFPLGTKGMQPEESIDRWPIRLTGSLVVLLRGGTVEVRDATSGALRHRWAAVRSEAPIALEDARGNFAVYKAGIALHVLRLSDGRDRMLEIADEEGPVHAELERNGLYYSYNTPAGAKHGRVAFVPLAQLIARFG